MSTSSLTGLRGQTSAGSVIERKGSAWESAEMIAPRRSTGSSLLNFLDSIGFRRNDQLT